MKNIKLLIAYDGTSFLGWQKTPLGPTIEESLEIVLEKIFQEKITLQAASRTDAGVHAEGQVVNFFTHKKKLDLAKYKKSINSLLPSSLVVLEIEEACQGFHPTLDNYGKTYQYFVCNTAHQLPKHRFFSWHVPSPINLTKMRIAAKKLLGEHDFSAFCNELSSSNKNPLCTLHSIDIEEENGQLIFTVTGDRFLFRMMRNLVGTLVYIGLGKIPPENLAQILESKKRANAGVTAPAHGLHLIEVFYKKNEKAILPISNILESESILC